MPVSVSESLPHTKISRSVLLSGNPRLRCDTPGDIEEHSSSAGRMSIVPRFVPVEMTDTCDGQLLDCGRYSRNHQAIAVGSPAGPFLRNELNFDGCDAIEFEARFGKEMWKGRDSCVHMGVENELTCFATLEDRDIRDGMNMTIWKDARLGEIRRQSFDSLECQQIGVENQFATGFDVRRKCSVSGLIQSNKQTEQTERNICRSPAEPKSVNRIYDERIQSATFALQSTMKGSPTVSDPPKSCRDASKNVDSDAVSQHSPMVTQRQHVTPVKLENEVSWVPTSIAVHTEKLKPSDDMFDYLHGVRSSVFPAHSPLRHRLWNIETEKVVLTVPAMRNCGRPFSFINGDRDSCARCLAFSALKQRQQRSDGKENLGLSHFSSQPAVYEDFSRASTLRQSHVFNIPTECNDCALSLHSPKAALSESLPGEHSRNGSQKSASLLDSSFHSQTSEEPLKTSNIPGFPTQVRRQVHSPASAALPKSISVRLKGLSPNAKIIVPPYPGNREAQSIEGAGGGLYALQGTYKTELCNKWEAMNRRCPYGERCRFAHGLEELRVVARHSNYKTQACRMISAGGLCNYGHRCHFRHALKEEERIPLSEISPCRNSSSSSSSSCFYFI